MLPISFNRDWEYCESLGNLIFDPRAAQSERIPVTLPHDAAICEKRSADAPGGTAKGFYPSRDYDYFKRFTAPEEWKQKRVILLFEGAYMNARVETDRDSLTDCSGELAFLDVWLEDAEGMLNPGNDRDVKITVEGSGVLQGIGSGNPCTEEDFCDHHCRTFFGHAFAAIRPTGAGEITVTVECEGLPPVVKHLKVVSA